MFKSCGISGILWNSAKFSKPLGNPEDPCKVVEISENITKIPFEMLASWAHAAQVGRNVQK